MAKINLTQAEADALLKMEKVSVDDKKHKLPSANSGGKIIAHLTSVHTKENFFLDINKYNIILAKQIILKQTYQTRARVTVILARLDFGPPHKNPKELGNAEVGSPHLHIYKEGYDDKYATEDIDGIFSDLNDPQKVLHDFMKYCNITQPPNFY